MPTFKELLIQKSNWELVKISDVCDVVRGFAFDSNKYKTKGNPIVKVLNVQDGEINDDEMVYFDPSDYPRDLSKYLLRPGEVCITIAGKSSGKLAINYHNKNFYVNLGVCRFEIKNQIIPVFFYFCLKNIQTEIHQLVRGGTIKNLPIKDFEDLKIPLPPIEIQEKIVEILDSLREYVKRVRRELEES